MLLCSSFPGRGPKTDRGSAAAQAQVTAAEDTASEPEPEPKPVDRVGGGTHGTGVTLAMLVGSWGPRCPPCPSRSQKSRLRSFRVRTISSVLLIGGFIGIIWAGHVPLMFFILLLQACHAPGRVSVRALGFDRQDGRPAKRLSVGRAPLGTLPGGYTPQQLMAASA